MFGFQPIAPGRDHVSSTTSTTTSGCTPVDFPFSPPMQYLSVGVPFYLDLNTYNTGGPGDNWSYTYLPPGLTMNTTTGVISGTPTSAGSSQSIIDVTNACTSSPLQFFIDWDIS